MKQIILTFVPLFSQSSSPKEISRMLRFTGWLSLLIIVLCLFACKKSSIDIDRMLLEDLHDWNIKLEEVIVTDFFPPPVAARIYSYPNIASYELLQSTSDQFSPLGGQIRDFEIELPKEEEEKVLKLASIFAFHKTARQLVFSGYLLDDFALEYEKELNDLFGPEVVTRARKHGDSIAEKVVAWAKKDKYDESRGYSKHTLSKEPGSWIPTPPDYQDALEPSWMKIRPFVLDSANQMQPGPPLEFSTDSDSPFMKEVKYVYETASRIDKEQNEIAKFWDCNPIVIKHHGHASFAEKKLTPGGHWMSIARTICKMRQSSLMETAEVYALLGIGLHDSFISCWEEKYRSDLIRPVSVINQYIDPDWLPILYTPNFPEHTSGHSVISSCAATILSEKLGDNIAFVDSTETPYGMPPRSFTSFQQAADEAAISRLYGGIHFRQAIEEGQTQGKKVGELVLKKVRTR